MLVIKEGEIVQGYCIGAFGYAQNTFWSRLILRLTRYLRAKQSLKYIKGDNLRLLDIGCGDGYFLLKAQAKEKYGVDRMLGDNLENKFEFPNDYFDFVVMLAVIEHLPNPRIIIEETARVLKPKGRLIITTPKKQVDSIIKIYCNSVDDLHITTFDLSKMKTLVTGLFEVVDYRSFLCNLNQIFCLEKKSP
jgi:ubiquinone/menaquinone biosynthesis C-methylase UbiE